MTRDTDRKRADAVGSMEPIDSLDVMLPQTFSL